MTEHMQVVDGYMHCSNATGSYGVNLGRKDCEIDEQVSK
jgi:hypothetical protein